MNFRFLLPFAVMAMCTFAACDKDTEKTDSGEPFVSDGLFSVSSNKKVSFAESNVTYCFADWSWNLANRPWATVTDYSDSVMYAYYQSHPEVYDTAMLHAKGVLFDRFRWGTGTHPLALVYNRETGELNYVDWGVNFGNEGWRTPTKDEMFYLLYERTNAMNLHGPARVAGVNGLLLLADDWVCPQGLSFNSSATGYSVNVYAEADWEFLKKSGAVFLPADGWIDPDAGEETQAAVGHYASYWLSSIAEQESNDKWAHILHFADWWDDGFHIGNEKYGQEQAIIEGSIRGHYFVRLVKDR